MLFDRTRKVRRCKVIQLLPLRRDQLVVTESISCVFEQDSFDSPDV
jgi:hypothetical protein